MANPSRGPELRKYLKKESLGQVLPLTQGGQIQFHWTNWKKTCLHQQEQFEENRDLKKFQFLHLQLETLKHHMVWLRNEHTAIQSNLHDLYEFYMDGRVRETWFGPENKTLVSCLCQSGPYVPLNGMRWFSQEIFQLFVMKKILEGRLPLRRFRLSTEIYLAGYFGQCEFDQLLIKLHQVTENGLLFKIDGNRHGIQLHDTQDVTIHFPVEDFCRLAETTPAKCMRLLREETNIFEKNDRSTLYRIETQDLLKYAKIESNDDTTKKEFFFFVPYGNMKSYRGDWGLKEVMPTFVKQVEKYFGDKVGRMSA